MLKSGILYLLYRLVCYIFIGWQGLVLKNFLLDRCRLMQMTPILLEPHVRPCLSQMIHVYL